MAKLSERMAEILEVKEANILEGNAHINLREARVNFSRIVDAARVNADSVIITTHGKPAAAIVPIEDYKLLSAFKEQSKEGQLFEDCKFISTEELHKRMAELFRSKKGGGSNDLDDQAPDKGKT